MTVRTVEYAEDNTRATHTGNTSYQDKTSLTFTPAANQDYFIYWGCTLDGGSGAVTVSARLRNDTTGTNFASVGRTNATSDRTEMFGGFLYTSPVTPVATTFIVQYATANSGNTVGIQDAWIAIIEKTSVDVGDYTTSPTELATTTNTYGDHTTITFTPATSGLYLIIAMAQVNSATSSTSSDIRLYNGTTAYGEATSFNCRNTGSYMPWAAVTVQTLSGSQTWKIQGKSNNTNTVTVRRGYIAAIRLDGLPYSQSSTSISNSTTSSSTHQDKISFTSAALANTTHLAIFSGIMEQGAWQTRHKYQLEGADILAEKLDTMSATSKHATFRMYKWTPTSATATAKVQFRSDGTNSTGYKDVNFFNLQLTDNKILVGGSRVDKLYVGSGTVARVYRGSNLLWGF
jgi:hypothetical protein